LIAPESFLGIPSFRRSLPPVCQNMPRSRGLTRRFCPRMRHHCLREKRCPCCQNRFDRLGCRALLLQLHLPNSKTKFKSPRSDRVRRKRQRLSSNGPIETAPIMEICAHPHVSCRSSSDRVLTFIGTNPARKPGCMLTNGQALQFGEPNPVNRLLPSSDFGEVRRIRRGRDPARASQEKRPLRFCRSKLQERGWFPVDITLLPSSGKVEAIKVHYLIPGRHEVTHECLLRVAARIDFREGSELRVGTED